VYRAASPQLKDEVAEDIRLRELAAARGETLSTEELRQGCKKRSDMEQLHLRWVKGAEEDLRKLPEKDCELVINKCELAA